VVLLLSILDDFRCQQADFLGLENGQPLATREEGRHARISDGSGTVFEIDSLELEAIFGQGNDAAVIYKAALKIHPLKQRAVSRQRLDGAVGKEPARREKNGLELWAVPRKILQIDIGQTDA
jgi:hypothetical protein